MSISGYRAMPAGPYAAQRVDRDHRHLAIGEPLLGRHPARVDGAGADLERVQLVRRFDARRLAEVVQIEREPRPQVLPQRVERARLRLGEVLPVAVEVDARRGGALADVRGRAVRVVHRDHYYGQRLADPPRLGTAAAPQVLEDLQRRLGAVQLVAVDPRLQPEDVRSRADRRVVQLPALARQAGAVDHDGAMARRLDRAQLLRNLLVAGQAAETDVLAVLDAGPAGYRGRRIGRRRRREPEGCGDRQRSGQPPRVIHVSPPSGWTPAWHYPTPKPACRPPLRAVRCATVGRGSGGAVGGGAIVVDGQLLRHAGDVEHAPNPTSWAIPFCAGPESSSLLSWL